MRIRVLYLVIEVIDHPTLRWLERAEIYEAWGEIHEMLAGLIHDLAAEWRDS